MIKAKDLVESYGCKYSHSGTAMLAYAANYVRDRTADHGSIFLTKEVYPAVGREFGCSGAAAERRMRTAAAACRIGSVGETIYTLANEDGMD